MQTVKLAISEAVHGKKNQIKKRNVLICSHVCGNRFVCALSELW